MLNTFESNDLQSNNAYATYYVNNLTSNILPPLTGMFYTYTKYGNRFPRNHYHENSTINSNVTPLQQLSSSLLNTLF